MMYAPSESCLCTFCTTSCFMHGSKCSSVVLLCTTYCTLSHSPVILCHTGSTQSLQCHTASGDNCTSSTCPNTVVNYTCTITDWTLPIGTCPTNVFLDKIRQSQLVSGTCAAQLTSTCGPCRAYSIQSFDPTYCLSSILTVNITAAMNGSTLTCSNTNFFFNTVITTVISSATIYVVGMLFAYINPFHCHHTKQLM